MNDPLNSLILILSLTKQLGRQIRYVVVIVCIGVSTPLKNTTPLFFAK